MDGRVWADAAGVAGPDDTGSHGRWATESIMEGRIVRRGKVSGKEREKNGRQRETREHQKRAKSEPSRAEKVGDF